MICTNVSKSTGMSMSVEISSTSFSSASMSERCSTSRTTVMISFLSNAPFPSLSKRLNACHKASLSQYSDGPMLTAVNSAKFKVPLASRSMASKISSASPSSSPYFLSTERISSTSRVPSPFLSMERNAFVTISSFSAGMSSAMTRMVNFLKVLSCVLKMTLWSTLIILLLLTRVLLRVIHGCLSTFSADVRIRPECLSRPLTTSLASCMASHSFPKATTEDLIDSFLSPTVFPGKGSFPVSILYTITPKAHMSTFWYAFSWALK
mmetsp:Transcript_86687/g.240400  ORF Transcript_86687/g.240400 Transcript_86687/m.240400 type:complete len:265 (+) Transcript_86687:353-1147(+)